MTARWPLVLVGGLYRELPAGDNINPNAITTTNTVSLGGPAGSEALRATVVASAVNRVDVVGAITTVSPTIAALGSDTNIGLLLTPKGTGQVSVSQGVDALGFSPGTGTVTINASGTSTNVGLSMTTKGTGGLSVLAGGVLQLEVLPTASAANYHSLTGGVAGTAAKHSVKGSDTNVNLELTPKGSGRVLATAGVDGISLAPGSGTVVIASEGSSTNVALNLTTKGTGALTVLAGGLTQVEVLPTTSAVNYHSFTGGATGSAAKHSAKGTDTDINIELTPKGAGTVVVTQGVDSLILDPGTGTVVVSASGTSTNVQVNVASKGTGSVFLQTGGTVNQFEVAATASAVNYASVTGGIAAASVKYTAKGTDTDITMDFTPKGAGILGFNATTRTTGLVRETSKTVVATNTITTLTVTTKYTYLTGITGSSLAITFPAASATIDGEIHIIMSTTGRPLTTWVSSGATFVGTPNSLTANVPVRLIYDHATLKWYLC